MKKIKLILLASIVIIIIFTGCGNLFDNAETGLEDEFISARKITGTTLFNSVYIEEGVLGPGAEYKIYLPIGQTAPPVWNGNLIVYSHGYVTAGTEFSDSDEYQLINDAIPDLAMQGYAVAYSSYSDSGWAAKDGTIRTRQLRDYFINSFGMPDHIYLFGVSEGALITMKLAEQNPELFSGALAFAGPIGGADMEFQYILDVRLAFDHFFKYYLKGAVSQGVPNAYVLASALGYSLDPSVDDNSAFDVVPEAYPEGVDSSLFISEVAALVGAIMTIDPYLTAAREMASVSVDGQVLFPADFWSLSENQQLFIPEFTVTIAQALWYNIYGTKDLLEKTHGAMPLDNTDSVYAYMDLTSGQIEVLTDIERFTSEPSGEKYIEHYYLPQGGLQIPVVTLHITRDPAVPFFHEAEYLAIYGDDDDMLTQVSIEGFGHGTLLNPDMTPDTTLTMNHIMNAFMILVNTVANQ